LESFPGISSRSEPALASFSSNWIAPETHGLSDEFQSQAFPLGLAQAFFHHRAVIYDFLQTLWLSASRFAASRVATVLPNYLFGILH